MQKVIALAALCVASVLGQDACEPRNFVAPAFDLLRFEDTMSYHDVPGGLTLYVVNDKPGEMTLIDFNTGKVWHSNEDGTCEVYVHSGGPISVQALAEESVPLASGTSQQTGAFFAFEYKINELLFRIVQGDHCNSIVFNLWRNGTPGLMYSFRDTEYVDDAALQPIRDAVDEFAQMDCTVYN